MQKSHKNTKSEPMIYKQKTCRVRTNGGGGREEDSSNKELGDRETLQKYHCACFVLVIHCWAEPGLESSGPKPNV